jgi:microsomal dipeptidase-like Zn-dependent dipeptidase
MMVPWAYSTNAGNDPGQLLNRTAYAEFLKAAKFHHIHESVSHIATVIKVYGYLGVALYSGYWGNCDCFHISISLLSRRHKDVPTS